MVELLHPSVALAVLAVLEGPRPSRLDQLAQPGHRRVEAGRARLHDPRVRGPSELVRVLDFVYLSGVERAGAAAPTASTTTTTASTPALVSANPWARRRGGRAVQIGPLRVGDARRAGLAAVGSKPALPLLLLLLARWPADHLGRGRCPPRAAGRPARLAAAAWPALEPGVEREGRRTVLQGEGAAIAVEASADERGYRLAAERRRLDRELVARERAAQDVLQFVLRRGREPPRQA